MGPEHSSSYASSGAQYWRPLPSIKMHEMSSYSPEATACHRTTFHSWWPEASALWFLPLLRAMQTFLAPLRGSSGGWFYPTCLLLGGRPSFRCSRSSDPFPIHPTVRGFVIRVSLKARSHASAAEGIWGRGVAHHLLFRHWIHCFPNRDEFWGHRLLCGN